MNDITYYVRGPVVEGSALKVFAKDKVGAIVGEYDGYYKSSRGVFILYPVKRSHIYGKLRRHEVAAASVRRAE